MVSLQPQLSGAGHNINGEIVGNVIRRRTLQNIIIPVVLEKNLNIYIYVQKCRCWQKQKIPELWVNFNGYYSSSEKFLSCGHI